jgi:hypothetical protein
MTIQDLHRHADVARGLTAPEAIAYLSLVGELISERSAYPYRRCLHFSLEGFSVWLYEPRDDAGRVRIFTGV